MSADYEIDWTQTARIERLERDAFKRGFVLINVDTEPNKILKRLAEDKGFSRFGPRQQDIRR